MKYTVEHGIDFDNRTLYIFGELSDELGTILRLRYTLLSNWWKDIMKTTFDDITIDISSYGGSIYAINGALDFYHELDNYLGVKVNTKAQGICMSAATVLLAGGTGERVALPKTRLMLHDLQIEGVGGTGNQVLSQARAISDDQQEIFGFYAQFSRRGLPPLTEKELVKETKKWMKRFTKDSNDHYISAKEALELKLIDRVI
jgi:ATP-dependent protease ClpP protease subunit